MTGPRVLQLVPALGDGGVERSAVEMARHLASHGLPSFIASAGGDLEAAVRETGATHIRLDVGAKSPLAIARNSAAIRRIVETSGIDIVHARSRAPAWAGWIACRGAAAKPRFVTTFHGLYGHSNPLKRWYNSVMLRGPLVIANSEFIRDHIVEVYGVAADRIVVAPRGVDPGAFDPAEVPDAEVEAIRRSFDIPEGGALVLLVGRLTRWKGQAVLIEALALLGEFPVVAVLVGADGGNGGYLADLEALARRLGVAGRVRFAGSRRDIAALNRAADLAVSASTAPEAFGRVAIEAMAMETPVVATAHGGSLETVLDGETGRLVAPGDASALATAIREMLGNRARLRAMGEAGRRHVLARFTTRRTVEAEFDVYRRLMEGPAT